MSCRIVEWEHGHPSLGRAVAAIGVFDGVHSGHRALISDTVSLAREHGALSVVVTFDRDPEQVVKVDANVPQLLTLEEKLAHIEHLGVDAIVVVPFCMRLAEMAPRRFLDDVLMTIIDPLAIVVGRDFRFGVHASGTVETLEAFGREGGFAVVPHELIERDGATVTSTRIRSLIAAGDVTSACKLLGRPHRVPGRVVHGRGEGGPLLGVPTANVTPWKHAALPADGVYVGRVTWDTHSCAAAISIGVPPMYPKAIDKVEAHLIGFEGDLYGKEVALEFESRLRGQRTFDSAQELAAAIKADISRADEIASAPGSGCRSEAP